MMAAKGKGEMEQPRAVPVGRAGHVHVEFLADQNRDRLVDGGRRRVCDPAASGWAVEAQPVAQSCFGFRVLGDDKHMSVRVFHEGAKGFTASIIPETDDVDGLNDDGEVDRRVGGERVVGEKEEIVGGHNHDK
jgi:hypothetical protein